MAKNIYYLGPRRSDIATDFDAMESDNFFKGSITCYGDGLDGNISYNSISGIQLCDDDSKYGERNDAIYTKFFGDQCRKIAESDPDAYFLPYSVFYADKIPDELSDRAICCNDPKALGFLNSKFNFKKLIDGKLNQAPFRMMKGAEILKQIESGEVPHKRELVIQTEFGAGGEGTIIAAKSFAELPEYAASIAKIMPDENYVVSDYIENLCSASVNLMISNNEIAMYPPGVQLMRGPSFIGYDVHAFSLLDEDIKNETIAAAKTFGEILRNLKTKKPIRGYIGMDFIISKNDGRPRLFAVETNPRFTGVTGLMNILCHKAGIGSVFEHAYKAFYDESTDFAPLFAKIEPVGRKRYAVVEYDKDGKLISMERRDINREGFDETAYREDETGMYTHTVFEQVSNFNVRDDREDLKKYIKSKYHRGELD